VNWGDQTPGNYMVSVTGPAEVIIKRPTQNLLRIKSTATITSSNTAAAARTHSIAYCGQSESHRMATEAGHVGFQLERDQGYLGAALGLTRSVWGIDAAYGASRVLKYVGVDTNYWWNTDTDTAGPNCIAAVAAIQADIAAGQPAPSAIVWWLWQGDIFGADQQRITDVGTYTPKVWEYLRTQLALPNIPIIISFPGSDDLPSESPGTYTAFREMLLSKIDNTPVTSGGHGYYRGPDSYDLALYRPYNDFHLNYVGQVIFGARLARYEANINHAQTNYTGPLISGVVETANGDGTSTYVATISSTEGLVRPDDPVGFAFTASGSAFGQTALVVNKPSWSGFTLTWTGVPSGSVLRYPWGEMGSDVHVGRLIRSSVSGIGLGSYKP
jgi:hypothetical protein